MQGDKNHRSAASDMYASQVNITSCNKQDKQKQCKTRRGKLILSHSVMDSVKCWLEDGVTTVYPFCSSINL